MSRSGLLIRAWAIAWRNRALWLFGIALALFSGNSFPLPRYNMRGDVLSRLRMLAPQLGRTPVPWQWLRWLQAAQPSLMALAGTLAVVGLVLSLLGILVRYTSTGAMVSAVDTLASGHKVTFGVSVKRGWGRFLRLLAIDVLIRLACLVLLAAVILGLAAISAVLAVPGILLVSVGDQARLAGVILIIVAGSMFALLATLAVIAFYAVASIVSSWAARACVLDRQGVFGSLGSGLSLLHQRAAYSLKTWLALALVCVVAFAIAVPIALVGVVLGAGFGVALWQATRQPALVVAYGIMAFVALGLVSAATEGLYQAFRSAYWTLAYREIVPRPATA